MKADVLAEAAADWLAKHVRRSGNSRLLIEYIENGGPITPSIREVVVDILTGKVAAKPRAVGAKDLLRSELKQLVESYREGLVGAGPDAEARWPEIESRLLAAGFASLPETKGMVTKAARALAADHVGLTISQLDARLSLRKSRQRKTE